MAEQITCTDVVSATPEQVYDAWIDGAGHAAMTGASATSDAQMGGEFTAWDGYIWGTYVALHRPSRIVCAWRTSAFPDNASPSALEITLRPADGGGTKVNLNHRNIPDGQGESYREGWDEHYFGPMKRHFAKGSA